MTTVTGRVATGGFTAPRYTPADFAEPARRPLLVRWTARVGALVPSGRHRRARTGAWPITMEGPRSRG
ncbi:MAG: hypothetical protein ACFCVF_04625 [Kineosporiaceae bacterium]